MLVLLFLACAPHLAQWPVDAAGMPTDDGAAAEIVRRRVHPDAADGSAQALENAAVDAERKGDLVLALDLAREAYVRGPDRRRMDYVDELSARVSDGVAATR